MSHALTSATLFETAPPTPQSHPLTSYPHLEDIPGLPKPNFTKTISPPEEPTIQKTMAKPRLIILIRHAQSEGNSTFSPKFHFPTLVALSDKPASSRITISNILTTNPPFPRKPRNTPKRTRPQGKAHPRRLVTSPRSRPPSTPPPPPRRHAANLYIAVPSHPRNYRRAPGDADLGRSRALAVS